MCPPGPGASTGPATDQTAAEHRPRHHRVAQVRVGVGMGGHWRGALFGGKGGV